MCMATRVCQQHVGPNDRDCISCMQDDTIFPAAGDKVTFKIATHLAAAKAAANSAALNKKYAGKSCCVTHANNYMRTGNFECTRFLPLAE